MRFVSYHEERNERKVHLKHGSARPGSKTGRERWKGWDDKCAVERNNRSPICVSRFVSHAAFLVSFDKCE